MLYRETDDGFEPWTGQLLDGIKHSSWRDMERLWSAEELAAIGLFAPTDLGAPDGVVVSRTVDRVDGIVQFVYEVTPPIMHEDDVWTERDRRLSSGFDYDFGGERGVHRINTTKSDMAGWDEVTKLAQAMLNIGEAEGQITIATGTGVTSVTAMEWQSVLIAAGAFRQTVWGASFLLEQMDPIPLDFMNDAYWS